VTRDRLQASRRCRRTVLSDTRMRGFRLDGYGVFFDVSVRLRDDVLTMRMLDQNDLGLDSAMKELQQIVRECERRAGAERVELRSIR